MGIADVVIIALVVGAVALCVRRMMRGGAKGECAGCADAGGCHSAATGRGCPSASRMVDDAERKLRDAGNGAR